MNSRRSLGAVDRTIAILVSKCSHSFWTVNRKSIECSSSLFYGETIVRGVELRGFIQTREGVYS